MKPTNNNNRKHPQQRAQGSRNRVCKSPPVGEKEHSSSTEGVGKDLGQKR